MTPESASILVGLGALAVAAGIALLMILKWIVLSVISHLAATWIGKKVSAWLRARKARK